MNETLNKKYTHIAYDKEKDCIVSTVYKQRNQHLATLLPFNWINLSCKEYHCKSYSNSNMIQKQNMKCENLSSSLPIIDFSFKISWNARELWLWMK